MKHVTLAGELKEFASAKRLFVVHAAPGWIEKVASGEFDFFTRLAPRLEEEGVASVTVELGGPLSEAMLGQNHMHVILGDRPEYSPRVMHVAPSYIWGFWYLDEVGINADSSIRMRSFRPHGVEWEAAEYFFNGVAGWMVEQNVSREPQPDRDPGALDRAQSVVFCQDIETRQPRQHYLSTEEMIRNAARAAGGGIVYVKPHPHQDATTRAKIDKLAESDPNIRVSEASVHDLIAASDWVVTQNSAAGFEALLQKKRLITCARSDFHHASLVARSGDELRAHLRSGGGALDGFEYEKYLYWFLSETCLEPQSDDFAHRAWARLIDKFTP
ncbi:MAG: hypothetical protein AAF714_07425 [Pseudomonadota bacterium]